MSDFDLFVIVLMGKKPRQRLSLTRYHKHVDVYLSSNSQSYHRNCDESVFSYNPNVGGLRYIQESQISSLEERHLYSHKKGQGFISTGKGKVESPSTDVYSSECQVQPQKPPDIRALTQISISKSDQMVKETNQANTQSSVQKAKIKTNNNQNQRQCTNFVKIYMQRPFRLFQALMSPEHYKVLGLLTKVTTFKHVFDQILKIKLYSDSWELFYPILQRYLEKEIDQSKFRTHREKIQQFSSDINEAEYQNAFKRLYNYTEKRWMPHYKTFKARITKLQPKQVTHRKMITRSQRRNKRH